MNKKFVYQVGNNKKSYTMMHGQPNININLLSINLYMGYMFRLAWAIIRSLSLF